MIDLCYIILALVLGYILLLGLFEISYFVRLGLTAFVARFIKKRVHILDTTSVTRTCYTSDIDTLLYHMNNSRYFREMDFARADFFERTGLYRKVLSKGGGLVQGAATIRYRRFIKIFSRYKISTRIVYWDDQSIFMEHKFLSLKDDFVHCIVLCRQRILKTSAEEVMRELLKSNAKQGISNSITNSIANNNNNNNSDNNNLNGHSNGNVAKKEAMDDIEGGWEFVKPSQPIDVAKWMEYNEISSTKLRNNMVA